MTGRPLKHWLLLFALVAMWGSSFVLTKIALAAFAPTPIVAWRLVVGAAVLVLLLVAARRAWPRGARLWGFFLGLAIVGGALPFWLISWGQRAIDSGLAGILMAIMPPTTLVLAHFFVAEERLNPTRVAGFLVAFAGIVVLMGPEALLEIEGAGTALLSQLAVLGGAICYAVAAIMARVGPPGDTLGRSLGVTLLGALIMMPLALATGPVWSPEVALGAAIALGMLGLFSTGIAMVVYFRLIAEAGPTFMSLINYLIPLWALVLGVVALGERPTWHALIALILVLSGIALSERKARSSAS